MLSRNRKYILFYLYVAIVMYFIFNANPKLFSSEPLITNIELSPIWNTAIFDVSKVEKQGTDTIDFYRGSIDRKARFELNRKPDLLKSIWKSPEINVGIHNASKASIVTDNERLYVGSDTSWFYSYTLNGKLLWKYYAGSAFQGIHSTAAVDDDTVYFGSYRGTLYALDKLSGRLRWMKILGHTLGASPLLYQGNILVSIETIPANGYLALLDRRTGEIIWKTPMLGEQAHSSPSIDKNSGAVIVGANNSTIQSFDLIDGHKNWSIDVGGEVKSTIIVNQGTGYATSWGRNLTAFDVKSSKILWVVTLNADSQSSPVFLENRKIIFVVDKSGQGIGVNANTGKTEWTNNFQIENQISSPIVVQFLKQEAILLYCKKQVVCLISDKGRVLNQWPVSGHFTGSPVIRKDRLYLSYDEGGIEAFALY